MRGSAESAYLDVVAYLGVGAVAAKEYVMTAATNDSIILGLTSTISCRQATDCTMIPQHMHGGTSLGAGTAAAGESSGREKKADREEASTEKRVEQGHLR